MTLDAAEKWARWAGGVGAVAAAVAVYSGVVQGSRRAKGRASGRVPALARGLMRDSPRFWVPTTALALGLLYALWRPIGPRPSQPARLAALGLGSLLYFPGIALLLWGRMELGRMHNVSSTLGVQLYADHRLITSGPFAWVRHPMYLGGMMVELGALLLYRTWATAFICINVPILPLRARLEEEALAAEFGERWHEYRRRVPAFLPRLRR